MQLHGLRLAALLVALLATMAARGVLAQGAAPPVSGEDPTAGEAAAEAAPETDLLELIPEPPPAVVLPEIGAPEVIDVPNDDGKALGILWNFVGATTETTMLQVQVKGDPAWLEEYRLTDAEAQTLTASADELQTELSTFLADFEAAEARQTTARAEMLQAREELVKSPGDASLSALVKEKRAAYWQAYRAFEPLAKRRSKLQDRLAAKTGKLIEKETRFLYLEAALQAAQENGGWLSTNVAGPAAAFNEGTKDKAKRRFGHEPQEGSKLYAEATLLVLPAPASLTPGTQNRYDAPVAPRITLPLGKRRDYSVQMVVSDGETSAAHELGGSRTVVNAVNSAKLNNMALAIIFALIILAAIALARKNPNLFIRRIAGLEAVDEAIGRATEMGKPVLYLNGMTALSDLPTLAAINILGRVARRVADFDSALLVPCRDPVVLSVAQEVVREGFLDVGRPDAYRDDNIFFVTEDQFSYTASVCALMVREKPAANFFMGYYFAESLLLAETGASTGAIQIAGTDSQSQLPFFITACDYTLIGEELYAASAYLSREPMLLGSLKGQDLGKAVIMLVIIVQTILFLMNPEFDWLKILVTPL